MHNTPKDRAQKEAQRLGQGEFWAKMRKRPDGFHALMSRYKAECGSCPGKGGGNRGRPTFSWVRFQQLWALEEIEQKGDTVELKAGLNNVTALSIILRSSTRAARGARIDPRYMIHAMCILI